MSSILITGVAGFIGSHLAERLLKEGHQIIGIDNFDPFYNKEFKNQNLEILNQMPNFYFIEADIFDKKSLDSIKAPVDYVFHLAAKAGVRPSIQNPTSYIDVNITGTNNVLNWMVEKNINKMIFASSSSIYGNNKKIPFNEEDVVDNPISPYAFTKKACELMNYTYHHLYNIDILNLRFFTVYGPRQRPDLAIRKFTQQIIQGHPISVYGDGSTARDYTYVGDIVDGLCKSLDYIGKNERVFEVINIGNSYPVRLIELIKTLSKIVGTEPVLNFQSMQAGDVDITYSDISKAKRILGYNPSTSLDDGLRKFVDWFKVKNEINS